MVHEVAARGFGRQADAYERSRPSYPAEAVAWLIDQLRLQPDARVADLGAGTGKLTRLLSPTGAFVIAIEPVGAMRDVLLEVVGHVPVVAGTAEALPLEASSLDAAVATSTQRLRCLVLRR